ncbi:MAG: MBL fold metallo-hydrolase [Actinomycetota bacterium]|nr:MBL fold metallo-hydrolase [Actinomycetota bacterium]
MKITKFGHACVRIESDAQVLVIDPGVWTEQESVDGATAVLLTHQHPDHLSSEHLRATDARIFTIDAVAEQIADQAPDLVDRVTTITAGQNFDAGLPVTAVGELHAVIHPDFPRISNSGYVVTAGGTSLYHPGDALTPPGREVQLLLVPVHAPWSKTSEVVDFARTVGAPKTVAVHDGLLNDNGLGLVGDLVSGLLEGSGQVYERVAPGQDIALP